jgi:hypothetical protein
MSKGPSSLAARHITSPISPSKQASDRAKKLCQTAQVLGDGPKRKLVLGATRAAQGQRVTCQVSPRSLVSSSISRGCRRVLEEEANHFATGVGPAWIRVGSGRAPTGPCVATPVKDPVLQR